MRGMNFYKVGLTDSSGEHQGFTWFASHCEALQAAKTFKQDVGGTVTLEEIFVAASKAAVLAVLNRHASHADNG